MKAAREKMKAATEKLNSLKIEDVSNSDSEEKSNETNSNTLVKISGNSNAFGNSSVVQPPPSFGFVAPAQSSFGSGFQPQSSFGSGVNTAFGMQSSCQRCKEFQTKLDDVQKRLQEYEGVPCMVSDKMTYLSRRLTKHKGMNLDQYRDTNKALASLIGTSLNEVKLENLDLGDAGFETFTNSLQKCTSINTLHLINMHIDCSKAKQLANTIKKMVNLTEIALGNNEIGPDGMRALVNAFPENLSWLSINYNKIGDNGAKALANWMTNNNLTSLCMMHNNIGDAGMITIINALPLKISALNLAGKFGDVTKEILFDKLPKLQNLSWFYLGESNLTNAEVVTLSQVLPKSITTLNLSGNHISDEGAVALTIGLPTTIQELYLSNNQIGDNGAKAVALAIGNWPNLNLIYLSHNLISTSGLSALNTALSNRRNLKYDITNQKSLLK